MKEITDNVLICPLNWGLGHAARCIPIIRELLLMHKKVIVAGHGKSLALLKLELPDLDFVELSSVEINYGNSGFSLATMLWQFPKMIRSVYKEHRQLKQVIYEKNIHLVISDNRYGCWSDSVKSIFITHQLFIKLPSRWQMLSRLVNAVNQYLINKYDECWVPDENGDPNLSGELSHGTSELSNLKFIGAISRFNLLAKKEDNAQFEVLVILSGPEPQRSILEEKLIAQLEKNGKSALIIRGKPDEDLLPAPIGNITFVNHLSADIMQYQLLNSIYIVCRSGYSSLMDLAAVGRSAIIIPTPGQTEQEYLADYHHLKGYHFRALQENFDLIKAFEGLRGCKSLLLENKKLAAVLKNIFNDDHTVN